MSRRARGLAAVVAVPALLAPAAAAQPQLATSAPVVTSKVTSYAGGTHLRWTARNVAGTAGNADADLGATSHVRGVGGGAFGIVLTGRDNVAKTAASWVSTNGGATWTEHLVPGSASLGRLAGHGGVLVAETSEGFWSSTDGARWTRATTGPRAAQWAVLASGRVGFVAFVRNGTSRVTRVWLSSSGAPATWSAAPPQSIVSSFCPTGLAVGPRLMVAVGADCAKPHTRRVLVSSSGRTWVRGVLPTGLRAPDSISAVSGRFLVPAPSPTGSLDWLWSTYDGRSWRHLASVNRSGGVGGWSNDRIRTITRLGAGWVGLGDRVMPADDASLVGWWSADLVHWSRVSPATSSTCGATVRMVEQAAPVGGRLVAVGNPWAMASACDAELWTVAAVR